MNTDCENAIRHFSSAPEFLDRIQLYEGLLAKWNRAINIVASGTLDRLAERHFVDSAQLLSLAPEGSTTWADLGSGGGFPGLVVAMLAASERPELRVTLVEADKRKAEFLRTVSRETRLSVDVRAERIENCLPLGADVISARALAPLVRLCDYAARHAAKDGTCLFMKGSSHEQEVITAREGYSFDLRTVVSMTRSDAAVLVIRNLRRV